MKLKLFVALLTLFGLVGMGIPAASATNGANSGTTSVAETRAPKGGCATYQKKYKNLKSKYKKTKRAKYKKQYKNQLKRYKACKTSAAKGSQGQQAATVRGQLAGYTYTGTRGDGASVIVTLCSNGKWKSQTYSHGIWGVSSGPQWYLRELKYVGATNWATHVGENATEAQGGWGIAMTREGSTFKVGVARSFGGSSSLGNVTQSSGSTICATL